MAATVTLGVGSGAALLGLTSVPIALAGVAALLGLSSLAGIGFSGGDFGFKEGYRQAPNSYHAMSSGYYQPPKHQPQKHQGYHQPQKQQGYHEPQKQQGYHEPQKQQGYHQPQKQQSYHQPQKQQSYQPQKHQHPKHRPQKQQIYHPPPKQQSYRPPSKGYRRPNKGYRPPKQQSGGYHRPQKGGGGYRQQSSKGHKQRPQKGYKPPQKGYEPPQKGYKPPSKAYEPSKGSPHGYGKPKASSYHVEVGGGGDHGHPGIGGGGLHEPLNMYGQNNEVPHQQIDNGYQDNEPVYSSSSAGGGNQGYEGYSQEGGGSDFHGPPPTHFTEQSKNNAVELQDTNSHFQTFYERRRKGRAISVSENLSYLLSEAVLEDSSDCGKRMLCEAAATPHRSKTHQLDPLIHLIRVGPQTQYPSLDTRMAYNSLSQALNAGEHFPHWSLCSIRYPTCPVSPTEHVLHQMQRIAGAASAFSLSSDRAGAAVAGLNDAYATDGALVYI